MNDLIRHIEYLLASGHECVAVPGLGAVLAHGISARYDESCKAFVAPSRSFSFNPELNHNDGMLAWSLARGRGLTYDAAARMLAEEVADLKRDLSHEGVLALGRVGVLNMRDGRLDFIPGDPSLLSPSILWLPQVNIVACDERRASRIAEVAEEDVVNSRFPRLRPRLMRAVKVAASLAVLVMLGVVVSTPIKVDNPQYASMGYHPVTKSVVVGEDHSRLLPQPGEASSSLRLVLRRHDDASAVADTAAHNAYRRSRRHRAVNAVTADEDRFCVVIASLASRDEAERFIVRNSGLNLGILAKDGRYRVYAATSSTYAGAQQAAKSQTIAGHYPDAWVCRR